MGRTVCLSVCCLNQWALDFSGNYERIIKSIEIAKSQGSYVRVGSELEIPGYSCQDHFLESDTYLHSWEVLCKLLQNDACTDILLAVGMPVMHKNTGYNCVVVILNRKILLIRPKMSLCDDRNYRESRWFCSWKKSAEIEDHHLPRIIQQVTGQDTVPFGDAVISTNDTVIGFETCEELWTAKGSLVDLSLDGVEIICNSSASHHELRKSAYQLNQLILAASDKLGGIYLFSNQRGCDGDRLYFDGNATIAQNGKLYARGKQFALADVEVQSAVLDIEDVRTYRNQIRSSRVESTMSTAFPRVRVDFSVGGDHNYRTPISRPMTPELPTPEQEIAYGPACWLWDYLIRSKQHGFFLPLSGGRDSAAVACMVYIMCHLVCKAVREHDERIKNEVMRLMGVDKVDNIKPVDLCNRILCTCYMSSSNSSQETRNCAKQLAQSINSSHLELNINPVCKAAISVFKESTQCREISFDGDKRENIALQNIQARSRMVLAYLNAQLLLWSQNRPGNLLVLGTANVDECLRGYLTKYDCSSADINPIGSISKVDLGRFLQFAREKYGITGLDGILQSVPTAELVPLKEGKVAQKDEIDMGMTYEELSMYGRLRKPGACGPFSMFQKLLREWEDRYTPAEIATKVKKFFIYYSLNRHKATVLTPAYHAETYSPDDNRHDHRPFLYNVQWHWQFDAIDALVDRCKGMQDQCVQN